MMIRYSRHKESLGIFLPPSLRLFDERVHRSNTLTIIEQLARCSHRVAFGRE